ncbi:MAG: hypothetical protein GX616_02985 [Planctomycetes bacterium]|nr:hypothetical protein [Planctomycetota bacterium]
MTPYAPYPLSLVRDWFDRRRWWIRLALAAVLVPWFGYFAYTRCTGQPARPFDPDGVSPAVWDGILTLPDPAVDRTRDMVAAIQSLPPLPTVQVPTTAPAGMAWVPASYRAESLSSQASALGRSLGAPGAVTPPTPSFAVDPDCALCGEWKPQDRYHLQQIISYLEQPATSVALARIRPLIGQPYCLSHSSSGMGGPAGGALGGVRQVAKLLTSRARYHIAHKRDFAAALQDIDTALQLAADTEREHTIISVLTGMAVRGLACSEVCLWEKEFNLSADQRREVIQMVQRHQIDVAALATASFELELRLTCSNLDMLYTKDVGGNGWLVLHSRKPGLDWLACENLLSPFFDDRRETLRRLDLIQRDARKAFAAHLDDGLRIELLQQTSREPECFPTCPWLVFVTQATRSFEMSRFICHANANGAAVITIHAIEAYRHRHGAYPAELSALVPEMLDSLPPDPCSRHQAPLRYRLDETEGYVLYSVGSDGQDEGGIAPPGGSGAADWVFPKRRSNLDTIEEWILAPAGTQRPQSTQASPAPSSYPRRGRG